MDAIPYCGPAPVPAGLWSQWNFDPWLVAAMLLAAAGQMAIAGRDAASRRGRLLFAAAGWALLAALFVSPLCALTSALFSARVAHHASMVAVAAPLLVLALPPAWRSVPAGGTAVSGVLIVHAALMWFWHAPAPYAAALASHAVFWAMELTLLLSALALWLLALSPRAGLVAAAAALAGAALQMGLLGAVITFARRPLYAPHTATTDAWGLAALADQQLAGLIMWVPATLPYVAAALALAALRLAPAPEKALR